MSDESIEKLVETFYECFDKGDKVKGGKQFEIFVKIFLRDIGFEDIEITGRPNDGGIDLLCYKRVIPGSNEIQEKYIVQAKKNAKNTKVNRKDIADLQSNEKENPNGRIFITTSSYTNDAVKQASINSKPVIIINGSDIINYYLNHPEKDVMFDWIPKISKERVKLLIEQEDKEIFTFNDNDNNIINDDIITKPISRNDIRARILPIPRQVYDYIKENDEYEVECFGERRVLRINKVRRYFSGITGFYKKAGYVGYSGDENKKSNWKFSDDKKYIIVELI